MDYLFIDMDFVLSWASTYLLHTAWKNAHINSSFSFEKIAFEIRIFGEKLEFSSQSSKKIYETFLVNFKQHGKVNVINPTYICIMKYLS